MGKLKEAIFEQLQEKPFDEDMYRVFGKSHIDSVLQERGKTYGQYVNVSSAAQSLKEVIHSSPAWKDMEPYMRESLDMICNKLSRIANGNPYYVDSWTDIGGYAKLVEDELSKEK